MANSESSKLNLSTLQQRSLIVGVVGLALTVAGIFVAGLDEVLHAYLTAYTSVWTIVIGCLGVTFITHLVTSHWGQVVRPFFAAGMGILPLIALLFLPIALGAEYIYDWANEEKIEKSEELSHIIQQKGAYLNLTGFWLRAAVYFVIWLALGFVFTRKRVVYRIMTKGEDASRLRYVSGFGMMLLILTATFAAVDWIMSLEPIWYSTIYGAVTAASGVVAAMALTILMVRIVGIEFTGVPKSTPDIVGDLASLLLGFVLIWTYFSFSQYLIIWSGDQPSESFWYIQRSSNGWEWIGITVVVFHFIVPFLWLLSPDRKRDVKGLVGLSLALLAVHVVDMFWNIRPAFSPDSFSIHWLDVTAPIGVGGLCFAAYCWQLKRQIALAPDSQHAALARQEESDNA